MITDACYAAYRHCETNDLLKVYWEEIKSKMTHNCISDYLITNSVHFILNKVIHYNTYDTLKWANERICAGMC